ncbi:hypothetical protein [Kitasatospora sp. NBC_00315]|uniref:hypothetical protein n=1 Tax=Kitasatospora sp. NBC_00315 TaxID=2975963 RepID=UPI003246D898
MSLHGQVGCGLWSSSCAVGDVCDVFRLDDADVDVLDMCEGWAGRWTATWSFDRCEVSCPIREISGIPMRGAEPVRHFSWHPRQHHRPGLEVLASTGRLHGFESLEERNFLRVLDFAGGIGDVLSQPFRIRFATVGGRWLHHIPDYLVAVPDGR